MRNLLFLLSLLFSVNTLLGQITINSSHMPQVGDTLRYSVTIPDPLQLAEYYKSGANQTWNFDSLRPIRQEVLRFVSSGQTPYSNTVPSNRIGLLVADTLSFGSRSIYQVYNFLNTTSSDFSIDYRGATAPTGLSFPFPSELKLVDDYVDKDEVFQFPLNYLDRDSSTFDFQFNNTFPPIYYGSTGYRINDVDGWGTVTTPYGTFSCLRLITDVVTYDTVSFAGQNFGIPSHTREYQWVSTQERIPILKLEGNVFGGNFVPFGVEYRDSVRTINPFIPPVALFRADSTNIQQDSTILIRNLSIAASSFDWSFQPNTVNYRNGTNAQDRNIEVSFTDTGLYSVQLIATQGIVSDTLLRQNYFRVSGSGAVRTPPKAQFQVERDTAILRTPFVIYNRSVSQLPATYEWSISPSRSFRFESGSDFTSVDSIVLQFLDTGYFEVGLIATNNDGTDTSLIEKAVYVAVNVGLTENEIQNQKYFTLYPNPAENGNSVAIEINDNQQIDLIKIYSIDGKLIDVIQPLQKGNVQKLNLSNLQSGQYLIEIIGDSRGVEKLIVR